MIIGIDIDNCITEIQKELNDSARNYAIKLGKVFDDDKKSVEETKNNGEEYKEKFKFTYEELKYFLKDIQEEIINKAVPRKNAVEVIKKLKDEGNKIYIITARDSEFHDDPYKLSKEWLDRNNVVFDKLIVNAREKSSICLQEDVDLFIDDNLYNCISVSENGIPTIRINDEKENSNNITTLKTWEEIYKYICNEKIVKIISYNEEYKIEINNFVNECMHNFIGRQYKNRLDLLDIDNYYIKSNGNFWLAIDTKNKKLVGTIALENRNNYGILKRFYVNKEYQKIGVGKKLYSILEKYVLNNTEISKIYLACGQILKDAHKFYVRNDFNQLKILDIDMHYAEDDDFFCKEIKR